MDPFAQLPNELLQEVFKHVPSLPGKFKLAAVKQKFRGAALKIMEEPIPLEINFRLKRVNHFEIPVNRWPAAVEVLAKRTRFSGISIDDECPEGLLDTILNIINRTDSLNVVKVFRSAGCNSALLEELLAKCEQLKHLNLRFPLSRFPEPNARAIDLGRVFKGKALGYLSLVLDEYPAEQLSAAFQSLAPDTLQFCMIEIRHPLNLVQAIRDVPGGMWSALTQLYLQVRASSDAQMGLFELMARMPLLRTCMIFYPSEGQHDEATVSFDQFADAVVSLFNSSRARTNLLDIDYSDVRFEDVPGCSMIRLILTLQQEHQQLQYKLNRVNLLLRSTNIRLSSSIRFIDDDDEGKGYCEDECVECRSFYPNVSNSLLRLAEETLTNGHLQGHQLDRFKAQQVAQGSDWKVSSVLNETQDLATITFETGEEEEEEEEVNFYITVDCGPCFDRSCTTCWGED